MRIARRVLALLVLLLAATTVPAFAAGTQPGWAVIEILRGADVPVVEVEARFVGGPGAVAVAFFEDGVFRQTAWTWGLRSTPAEATVGPLGVRDVGVAPPGTFGVRGYCWRCEGERATVVVLAAGTLETWEYRLVGDATVVAEQAGDGAFIFRGRDFERAQWVRPEVGVGGFEVRDQRGIQKSLSADNHLLAYFLNVRPWASHGGTTAETPGGTLECPCTPGNMPPEPGAFTFHVDRISARAPSGFESGGDVLLFGADVATIG